MSADSTTNTPECLKNVRIVLVEPLYGGNVGAVCRAMANMGFSDLALVAPRDLDIDAARMMACHSLDILESRSEFPTLAEAVADCGIVVGTSARGGLYRRHSKSPRDWAMKIIEGASTGKAAILFGREDDGLSNEETAICTHIIRIPTDTRNTSLNVAQAALLCCYELFVACETYEPPKEKSPEAPSYLREKMFAIWRQLMLDVGFAKEDKVDHMMFGLRRILSRGPLSVDDVKIMMGIARQSIWAAKRDGRSPTPLPDGDGD